MPLGNEPTDRDIHALLKQVEGDEDLAAAAREYLHDYIAFALARPNQPHVDLLRAILKTHLTELIAAARRDGRL